MRIILESEEEKRMYLDLWNFLNTIVIHYNEKAIEMLLETDEEMKKESQPQ